MKLEKRGPTGLYSMSPSMLSTMTTLSDDLAPSSKIYKKNYLKMGLRVIRWQLTFFIAAHFAISVNPIILCEVTILTKGNPESRAISTANAVLPAFGGPSKSSVSGRYVSTSASPTARTANRPIFKAANTDSPHVIIPRGA
ncbi:hypothetical protein EG68_02082 [Paragonimus skrjabini miyazakii]|uniref:Uncharacterized protein n=1 Tax=Paragonimus skrjabini miyazakii TaxID=59628 RepID=A0A8S9ZAH9_9TREM|nr:hypothetical protein EG68_02082 [Paragonimus skrjabini miyazakii]